MAAAGYAANGLLGRIFFSTLGTGSLEAITIDSKLSEMLRQHPLLSELQSSVVEIVPNEPVSIAGEWTSSRRRSYQSEAQTGSGTGPFVEIVDMRWTGKLVCSVPIACIAFLLTPHSLSWAKSSPASLALPVDLTISAYAAYARDRATFAACVGGAYLPSLPMRFSGEPAHDVMLDTTDHATGRLDRLAQVEHAELLLFMIPGSLLKVGRKRLWHIRRDVAAALPSTIRELLTRGRNGTTQS